MLEKVDWDRYGVVDGAARDTPREKCMVDSCYDPNGPVEVDAQFGDTWKNIRYNFGPRPPRSLVGERVNAFNGISAGKSHLACSRADQTHSVNQGCSEKSGVRMAETAASSEAC